MTMSHRATTVDADGIIAGDLVVDRGQTIRGVRAVTGDVRLHIGGCAPDLMFIGGQLRSGQQDCLIDALSLIEDKQVIERACPALVGQGIGHREAEAAGRTHASLTRAAAHWVQDVESGTAEVSGPSL